MVDQCRPEAQLYTWRKRYGVELGFSEPQASVSHLGIVHA